jgi:acetyl-CoA synthetase
LEFRLQDSEAVVAIGDAQTLAHVQAVRASCPDLRQVIGVRLDAQTAALADVAYELALAGASDQFELVSTRAEAPAILIYTSGTTGNPKGALIPHQALIGNLTGFLCSQNWFGFAMTAAPVDSLQQLTNPQYLPVGAASVFWSPADWAWTGGLMDALLPALYFGRPIVAFNGRFGPQVALELLRDFGVTHTFLFPTALKAMMKACPGRPDQTVNAQFGLKLQAIMSAGEAVGDAVFDYCQSQLGVTVNEMFGQTEINYIVGNCVALWPPKPGSMGMGYPGHRLAVIDDAGTECAPGEVGDVAVNRFDVQGQPDPIFFLGYWKNEASTQAKFTGDWCRTGDLASRDADGYLWYQGRSDDVFKAAGYRIGPGEIENCLVKHPAVANVAVVPKPDAARGAVVKAYVVLSPDFVAARANHTGTREEFEDELLAQLQAHVKDKLAPYEYPKDIEFLDALPMTTTGKVQRRVLRLQEEARALALKATTTSVANT